MRILRQYIVNIINKMKIRHLMSDNCLKIADDYTFYDKNDRKR